MKQKSWFRVGSITTLIFLAINVSGCAKFNTNNKSSKIVHIAANLPLTGALATYGVPVHDGALMAIDELRRADPNGPKIVIDWQDNAGEPRQAVSIMQKQLLNPPDIYMSGVHPQTMAIREQVAEAGIPHFVWIFMSLVNRNFDNTKIYKNHLRTWVNFKIEPLVFLNYVKARMPKRVALIYVNLPSCQEEYEKFVVPGLKKLGINHIFIETYEMGTRDYKTIAVKVKQYQPDLILLSGFQDNFVGLIRALRPLNLIHSGNTLASYDMLDAAKILGKDEMEDVRLTAPTFVTRPELKEIKQWTERFRKMTGRQPLYTDAFAYDAIMIIADAAKRLHLPASSGQWLEFLRATKLQGITGPLSFDEDGSLITPIEIGVYRNGKIVPDAGQNLNR